MIEKIKDWIYGVVFPMMVMVGMFITSIKGETEEDDE